MRTMDKSNNKALEVKGKIEEKTVKLPATAISSPREGRPSQGQPKAGRREGQDNGAHVGPDISPGVTSDEGESDEWPEARGQILDGDIFVSGTPIWMGHPANPAQRALERLDAFLGETGPDGRMVTLDKVAIVAVVGNEHGADHVAAELFQGLTDVGFTIPAGDMTYWVGEAVHSTDYKALPDGSEKTNEDTKTAATNAAHLARLLANEPYPA